jgi:Flp pilus assembly protein TadG
MTTKKQAIVQIGQRLTGLRQRGQQGQVLIITALGMVVLLGVAALAIDVGVATAQKRSAQAAADAAALAGAVDLPGVTQSNSQAASDATETANKNLAKSGITNATVTVSSPPATSSTHNGDPSSVEVTITAKAPTFFLGILNSGAISIKAHAVATGQGSLGTPPILILDPAAADSLDVGEDPGRSLSSQYQPKSGITLAAGSNSTTTVKVNGPVYTNSVANDGEEVHANYNLSAASNHVAGADQSLCSGHETCGQFSPPPVAGNGTQFPDPLAYLDPPTGITTPGTASSDPNNYCSSGPPPSCNVTGNGSVTVTPGVWKDLTVSGSGSLTLQPGAYVITGSLQLTGTPGSSDSGTSTGTVTGHGVTLFFGCPSASAPYWAACPNGGGVAGQKGNSSCPNDCTGAASTSGCPNTCSPGGFLNLQSAASGSFSLTALTAGTDQGLLVFFDRNNYVQRPGEGETNETFNIEIIGGSRDTLDGTIYAERSNQWIASGSTAFSANSCIIVNSLGVYGPKNFTLSCTPQYNAIPSSIPFGGASLTE